MEPLSQAESPNPMAESMLVSLLGDIDPFAFAPTGAPPEHAVPVTAEALPFVIDDFYEPVHHQTQPIRNRQRSSSTGGVVTSGWLEEPRINDDFFNTRHVDSEALKGLGGLVELG